MIINRENYEIFFLDYHDGRLEPGQVAELFVFLKAHPELKEEFEDYENIFVAPDMSISYDGKTALRKDGVRESGPINAQNYENYFLADTENQLTTEEKQWLSGFLTINPILSNVYGLYLNARLQPDRGIQYPGKKALKRSIFDTRRFYYYTLSAAASIALLFAIYMNSGTKQQPLLAARQEPLSVPPINNNTASPTISMQEKSAQELASKINKSSYQPVSVQLPVQSSASNERPVAERKSIAEIPAKSAANITSRDIVEPEFIFIRQSRNKPDIYTTLYDQINLAERMQNEQVLSPVVSSPETLLLSGLRKFGSIFTGRETHALDSKFNFWTIADLGISGYNLLTDRDLKLLTQSNDSGKVVSYAIKSEQFEFTRMTNKLKNH